jgi:hypothetical protein
VACDFTPSYLGADDAQYTVFLKMVASGCLEDLDRLPQVATPVPVGRHLENQGHFLPEEEEGGGGVAWAEFQMEGTMVE